MGTTYNIYYNYTNSQWALDPKSDGYSGGHVRLTICKGNPPETECDTRNPHPLKVVVHNLHGRENLPLNVIPGGRNPFVGDPSGQVLVNPENTYTVKAHIIGENERVTEDIEIGPVGSLLAHTDIHIEC